MKEKVNFDSTIQETLLIPLLARGLEVEDKDPQLEDCFAREIIEHMEYDFTDLKKTMVRTIRKTIVARTLLIDRYIETFIKENANPVVISLGCGLDTRAMKYAHGKVKWYNLDLNQVIRLRKELMDDTAQTVLIEGSVFDERWPEKIEEKDADVLILLEGILMYFQEEEVKQIMKVIVEHFPSCQILLEVVHPVIPKLSKPSDDVNDPDFRWGTQNGEELTANFPKLKVVEKVNVLELMKKWGLLYRICSTFKLTRALFNSILIMKCE